MYRITVCVLHDFLLNVNSDLGRDPVGGFSDGYTSVSCLQDEAELTNRRNEIGQLFISHIQR